VTPSDLLQALEVLVAAERARQTGAATPLPDNQREDRDDGTSGRESDMCRIDGPFKHRQKYRLRVVDRETGRITRRTFETEEEAKAAIPKLRAAYKRPTGVTLDEAFTCYATYLADERQNRPGTIETTLGRVRALFRDPRVVTDDLTASLLRGWWQTYRTSPISKAGKLPSTDTLVGVLKQSRTFVAWLVAKGWVKHPALLDDLKVTGKRRRGKPQLRFDDARRYEAKARELADQGDVGAIAALVPLYMGTRAGEVVGRRVRDLDDRGRLLHIEYAKTEAGNRPLEVPDVLQPYLQRLAANKESDAPLFTGSTPRARRNMEALKDPVGWLRRQVARVCKIAGVPVVGPHGLRGTHGSLASEVGTTSSAIAQAMGHASSTVTERHYIRQEAMDNARINRVVAALN
jgi:integrase